MPGVREHALRVLLLEDSRFDAELTSEMLTRDRRCDITHVDSGDAFRRALVRGRYDIVLSDFSIPGFSGTEALEAVLQQCPDTPFVFISGVLGEEHAVDMLKRGATDYVVKSRLSRLPLVVDRAIAESRERKQREAAERALRESESIFSRVIESLQDYAVILLSPDGAIRSWNSASEKAFGYVLSDVQGKSARLLFRAEDRASGAFEDELQTAADKGSAPDDRWLMRRDGSTFFANGVTTAIFDEQGTLSGFSKIVRDTTEARWAAEALQTAKLEAERASQAKDRFIAVLSHELRTPLVPIMSGAQLLELHEGMPPDAAGIVAMIRRNAALEARLIEDLLDVTSIERGKLTLDMRAMDARDALNGALETTREELERRRMALEVRVDAETTLVFGDEARLQQILWNLIRNAVKFTRVGGELRILVDNPTSESLRIRVRDNGIGISPATLPKIFSPFEQADPGKPSSFGGLGLGLAIARGLALKHGGELTAASDGLGLGATFELTLRTAGAAERERDLAHSGNYEATYTGNATYSVLLVEDNVDAETVLRLGLEGHGHTVVSARSVAEARAALDAHSHFDILVSDIGLPDGSGLDVIAAVNGRFPAIALSGYGMEENLRASREAGFVDHLIKPVDGSRLLTLIAATMQRERQRG